MCPFIHISSARLSLYLLCQVLSILIIFISALVYNYSRGSRYPVSPLIIIFVSLPAFLGGRIAYFVTYPNCSNIRDLFNLDIGGTYFWGTLVGGMLGYLTYAISKKIPILSGLDLLAPWIPLGAAMGRLGCFCAGCCWGKVSSMPWAISFPSDSFVFNQQVSEGLILWGATSSLPVHPTQLYSLLALMSIWPILLFFLLHVKLSSGSLFFMFIILYSSKRFILDFFRADHPVVFFHLNFMQCISVVLIIIFLYGLIRINYLNVSVPKCPSLD